jgi:DNA-binding GntR family transcriptional regulator
MILSGEIKHGSRIREDALAKQLEISRTPIREAVNRLTQNGFITTIQRKGLYCVKFTRKELLDIIELRITLETLAIEKCIALASEEDILRFQMTISEFQEKLEGLHTKEDADSNAMTLLHNEYDIRFHVDIARISTSTRLIQYVSEVENLLLVARQRIYSNNQRVEIIKRSWEQHRLMLDAIRTREKKQACALLEEHLALMKETQVNVDYFDEIAEYSEETAFENV